LKAFRGLVVYACAVAACGGSSSRGSSTSPPPASPAPITVNGTEHLGWTEASDPQNTYTFAVYVDDLSNDLSPTCGPSSGTSFDCQAPLPPLTPGTHKLELVARTFAGGSLVESPRAAPVFVTMVASASADVKGVPPTTGAPAAGLGAGAPIHVPPVATSGGACGIASWPEGGVLLWDQSGHLETQASDSLSASLSWRLRDDAGMSLAAAVAGANFGLTRFVYLVLLSPTPQQTLVRIEQYRELSGTLGERRVLFDQRVDFEANGASADASTGTLRVMLLSSVPAAAHPFVLELPNVDQPTAGPGDLNPAWRAAAPVAAAISGSTVTVVESLGAGAYAVRVLSSSGAAVELTRFTATSGVAGLAAVMNRIGSTTLIAVDGDGRAHAVTDGSSWDMQALFSDVPVQRIAGLGNNRVAACGTGSGGLRVLYATWRG
jgi:hypothetical protein